MSLIAAPTRLLLILFLFALFADVQAAIAQQPKIAVFSGPTATIQNSEPLVTSNKAREKYALPLLTSPDGTPIRFDAVRPQRLAAPVSVYVEAFSAHPLERDVMELYAPPDGYVNPQTGVFDNERRRPGDVAVYAVRLLPEDGLYLLPYMARQADGSAWMATVPLPVRRRITAACRSIRRIPDLRGHRPTRYRRGRQEQSLELKSGFRFLSARSIGRLQKRPSGERAHGCRGRGHPRGSLGSRLLHLRANSGGTAMPTLARLTNMVQRVLATGEYQGAIWLEGSPTTEETTYWLGLLIDTTVPIVGNSSQRTHGMLSNDGDRNIVDSVDYILLRRVAGRGRTGHGRRVMIQEEQIFTARDVQKGDDRPGGYLATGGHGGIVGGINPIALTFVSTKRHTHTSEVSLAKLPTRVMGVRRVGEIEVRIKDDQGELLESAIPKVTLIKHARYLPDDFSDDPDSIVEVLGRIEKNLVDSPLAGFVLEGQAPYSSGDEPTMAALKRAALTGMPVARVGRGHHEGFTPGNSEDLFIEGSNLTATKAAFFSWPVS